MALAVAVAVSVVFTLMAVALFFWIYKKLHIRYTSEEEKDHESFRSEESAEVVSPHPHDDEFQKLGKNVKGLIVKEGGIDVVYLRKLEDGGFGDKFPKVVINPSYRIDDDDDEEEKRVVVDSAVRMVINDTEVVKPNFHREVIIPPPLPPLPLPPRAASLSSKVSVPPGNFPDPPLRLPPRFASLSSPVSVPPENFPDPPLPLPPRFASLSSPVSVPPENFPDPPLPLPPRFASLSSPASVPPENFPDPPLPLPPRFVPLSSPVSVPPENFPDPPLPLPPRFVPLSSPVSVPPEKFPDPPLQPPAPPPPPPSQPRRPSAPIRRSTGHALAPQPSHQRRPPAIIKRISGLPVAPPPPPPPGAKNSSLRVINPPTAPNHNPRSNAAIGGPTKLKPLHWDKIAANTDHSLVWDEINDGSLRFDDELMETLFAYTNGGDRRYQTNGSARTTESSSSNNPIFILDPRKSQNAAIVLKSIRVSRSQIIDALLEGEGLSIETLEKLNKMAPTHEEATKILQFNGNPNRLADAEAFLFHILKAVPSAFTRFKSLLFRLSYDSEILHLKESLQTLELGCKELRTRGLFLKLLEAILKAGNRMNAGTARGNAQGFNLTALGKIADIKSSDGKTTLLHFVVEQVVRSEGKRCSNSGNPTQEEETEKEFLLTGLKQLETLSNDFSNVKKAALIDYEGFINTSSNLSSCVVETRKVVISCCGDNGGFLRGMKEFLEGCDEELKVVKEEQVRVMELVRRTTEYYHAKGLQPLQLFVLVKAFLSMVDRVRVDITQKMMQQQKKNTTTVNAGQSTPPRFFTGYTFGLGKDTTTFGITGSILDHESDDDF